MVHKFFIGQERGGFSSLVRKSSLFFGYEALSIWIDFYWSGGLKALTISDLLEKRVFCCLAGL